MYSSESAAVTALGVLLLTAAAWAVPPVFSEAGYAKAKERAAADGKLLLLDATAEWCMPCKQMDKTTWVDEHVTAWVKAHAVAVQFDVDKDQELARAMKISAMPTIIVIKDGKEFDRAVGYQTPDELIAWLDGVGQGRTRLDDVRRAAGDRAGPQGTVNVRARLDLARAMLQGGKLDEATDEYAWLWDHMLEHERSFVGVRGSFMASEMEELAAALPAARDRFTQLRGEAEKKVKENEMDPSALSDWVVLNRVVDDEARTLEWFDRAKGDPQGRQAIDRLGFRLERVLLEHERWADLGRLYKDPVAQARRQLKLSEMRRARDDGRADMKEQIVSAENDYLRESISRQYAALLAAERDKEADEVAGLLLGALDDPSSRRELVSWAHKANQPRPDQRRLLDEADAKDTGPSRRRPAALAR